MKRYETPAHRRAKATIKAAAAAGAGIEFLPDAPTFRFEPVAERPLHSGPPSARGGFTYPNRWKLRSWSPRRLDYAPQYEVPMAGDDYALTDARRAWSKGNPKPLREWLANVAAKRRALDLAA